MSKLNVGSGRPRGKYKKSHQWLNIDIHEIPGVRQTDFLDVTPYWREEFDEVHAIHCLEHVNRNRREEFVEKCAFVLEPGGVCYIEVPDFEATIRNLIYAIKKDDHVEEHRMTTSVFGKQRYPGDQHCWGFTNRTLYELCEPHFDSVEIFTDGANREKMISEHWNQERVLLAECKKKR